MMNKAVWFSFFLSTTVFHRWGFRTAYLMAGCGIWPALSASAQVLTNQGLLHLSEGTVFTINGSVQNSGMLTNNGTFHLSGDWTNRSSYQGRGTFVLNGSQLQVIDHSPQENVFQSMGSVIVTGGGEKIWRSATEIERELVLEAGLLTPLEKARLLLGEKTVVTGGSKASYVNGALYHRGGGYRFFPVGKDGYYRPLAMDQISGLFPIVGIEAFHSLTPLQPGSDVQSIPGNCYWENKMPNTVLKGTFLTLYVYEYDHVQDLNRLIVLESEQATGPYRSLGGDARTGSETEGTVTSALPVSATYFSLGTSAKSSTAPTEVLYLPNTFSPAALNPDEKVWKIYGQRLTPADFELRIYNRWGSVVLESHSLVEMTERGWDGTNPATGIPESAGVYTYTLKGKLNDGKPLEKTGIIHLLR
jgi:hypothetical protein